ncbi:MAG: helix-turn-helix transcriptional regulator [Tissierella sp.]|uniref:helix-turn-helix transcriptional regulator n=1 Tax=Tissierella sp. TaxID=41274 RepID=UPI003F97A8FD
MDISSKIKSKRTELDLTQQDLAEKVFVTRQTISKWELGKSTPDFISLKLLEKALAIDLIENKTDNLPKKEGSMNKKIQFKDIIVTLLFGFSFLPLRIVFTINEKYKSSKLLIYVIKPALIALFLYFIGNISSEALNLMIFATIAYYLALNFYNDW